MNLIEKAILEWSLKTKKGYPDLNNEEDMRIFESMFGFRLTEEKKDTPLYMEQYTVADLIDMLQEKGTDLSTDLIQDLYHKILESTGNLEEKIKTFLEEKNLTASTNELLGLLSKIRGGMRTLHVFTQTESKHLTLQDMGREGNLISLAKNKTGLPEDLLKGLLNAGKSSELGKGVGKGELYLALLGRKSKKEATKGDILLDGHLIEVKAKKGRLGDRAADLKSLYAELENITGMASIPGENVPNLVSFVMNLIAQYPDKQKEIEGALEKEFKRSFRDSTNTSHTLEQRLISCYVEDFLERAAKESEYILIIVDEDYRLYSREEFRQAALSGGLVFTNFSRSSRSPQIEGWKN